LGRGLGRIYRRSDHHSPQIGHFGVTALILMGAAILFVLYPILTRMAEDRDPAATSLGYTGVVGLALCLAVLPFV
jgi:O-antigen/teichoic acid export membrane protein